MENQIYDKDKKLQKEHLLEQYKLYVEMADRISSRRNLANVFFLSLNTSAIAAIGLVYQIENFESESLLLIIPSIAFLVLCYVWFRLIKSYRQLNTAKYKVIGELEKMLPSSPYYKMEWEMLGHGKDRKLYMPLTKIEGVVPAIFGLMYLLTLFYLVYTI